MRRIGGCGGLEVSDIRDIKSAYKWDDIGGLLIELEEWLGEV